MQPVPREKQCGEIQRPFRRAGSLSASRCLLPLRILSVIDARAMNEGDSLVGAVAGALALIIVVGLVATGRSRTQPPDPKCPDGLD